MTFTAVIARLRIEKHHREAFRPASADLHVIGYGIAHAQQGGCVAIVRANVMLLITCSPSPSLSHSTSDRSQPSSNYMVPEREVVVARVSGVAVIGRRKGQRGSSRHHSGLVLHNMTVMYVSSCLDKIVLNTSTVSLDIL